MAYAKNGNYILSTDSDFSPAPGQQWPKEEVSYRRCPKPSGLFFECGCNPQDAIFAIDDERVERHQSFVLDSVVVDTTGFCRPVVRIEFSSLVFFEAEADNNGPLGSEAQNIESYREKELEVDLLFELVRICSGVEETVQSRRYLKEFEIERDDELEVEFSESFSVAFCDRTCPGCCTYKMIVKGKDFEGEFEALRVVKPNIAAFVQDLICK